MQKLIWYIHGANATPSSFQRIKEKLPRHDARDIAYSVAIPLGETINTLITQVNGETRPIHVVSHSLGGVLAVALAQRHARIARVATLSAPFGGSRVADMLRWWFPCQLYNDIHSNAPVIQEIGRRSCDAPVLSIVTTGGATPLITEPNDGVVSVTSQMALDGPTYIKLPLNHFEVLLADDTLKHLGDFLFNEPKRTKRSRPAAASLDADRGARVG
jgi:pimeloyl-ACP methyl ester carboxylesterase